MVKRMLMGSGICDGGVTGALGRLRDVPRSAAKEGKDTLASYRANPGKEPMMKSRPCEAGRGRPRVSGNLLNDGSIEKRFTGLSARPVLVRFMSPPTSSRRNTFADGFALYLIATGHGSSAYRNREPDIVSPPPRELANSDRNIHPPAHGQLPTRSDIISICVLDAPDPGGGSRDQIPSPGRHDGGR
ncbi:uncharacterized protein N7482_001885 [Penicillium canariense]|uniref:Uncharacterized protein n=1 Tax=Penicillium canariense TaxID=189055 RepID=A0A9W9IFZ6_9EURO|nr:uncharacterized protein N7482_001885 [Penicillium canariense]KAJ5176008.1 hypothetical protein N7482_001885 [Penicillium canariense]